jgi:ribosomal protein S18 acetylase RimI-like enzyme
MIIRDAVPEDKDRLEAYFKHYGSPEIISNRLDCYLSYNHTVVAEEDNKIIGILQWLVKEDPRAGVAELEEVNVLETHRGKGVGTSLIRQSTEVIKKYFNQHGIRPRIVYLFVSEENGPARSLYEKCDFKQVSNVANLFSDKSTELVYLFSYK